MKNTDGFKSIDLEYLAYIEKHIETVKLVWNCFKNNENENATLLIADDFNYFLLKSLIEEHDKSKYSDDEFFGYRCKFYPSDEDCMNQEERDRSFDFAWNHHQKTNLHHWEYWVTPHKILPMPSFYVLEMLIDWTAMALTVGNCKPSKWYGDNMKKMFLHESTINTIDNWINVFDEVYICVT